MNIFLWIITYLIAILVGIYIGSLIEKWLKTPSESPTPTNVTIEGKQSDLSIVYEYLDKYILKELHNFTTKDFTFDPECDIKILSANSYRTLIKCLLSPKQYITSELVDGTKQSTMFFTLFINKIYINYISETPKYIRDLVFKYFSGYTKDEYFMNKKERPSPSALPFVTDYVRNYLWCRFEENDNAEHEIINIIKTGGKALDADSVEVACRNYDDACCRKLTSNIYHSYDVGREEEPSNKNKDVKTSTNPKDISKFAYKFTTDHLPAPTGEEKE